MIGELTVNNPLIVKLPFVPPTLLPTVKLYILAFALDAAMFNVPLITACVFADDNHKLPATAKSAPVLALPTKTVVPLDNSEVLAIMLADAVFANIDIEFANIVDVLRDVFACTLFR